MTKLKYVLILIVLGISVFTHLYRIDKTFVFHNDEGRDALIAYRMIDTGKPVILGPETSVGNMYLGPFYYYLMVPPLILSGLDPVGPAIMVAVFGIFTTLALVYLGHKWGSTWAGIVAGLFYSLSPVMLHYSRSSWNPNVIPFFTTLLLLNWQSKSRWEGLWFGILTGIIFQLHYVALVLPGLIFLHVAWQHFRAKKIPALTQYLLAAFVGFLLSSSPFWLFELRHDFVDTRAFGTYLSEKSLTGGAGYPSYLTRLGNNIETVARGIVASQSVSGYTMSQVLLVTTGSILLVYGLISFKNLGYLLFCSLAIVSLLKESVYVHYLSFLFPTICLILGFAITKGKILSILTIALMLALAKPTYLALIYNLHDITSIQTIRAKNVADYIVKESNGAPYNIVNASSSSSSTILYYLAISTNPPSVTDQPLLYVICENSLCKDDILTAPDLFVNGPAHPTIIDYLGYTPKLHAREPRILLKNEWVTYEIYIATVQRQP